MAAFFDSLLSDVVGGQVSKSVREAVRSELQAELFTRIFTVQMVGPWQVLLNTVTDAYAASVNSSKPFYELVAEALKEQLLDQLKSLVKLDLAKLGAAAVK